MTARSPAWNTAHTTPIIFIEGDGRAWINRSTPSTDPTPRAAVALELAANTPDIYGVAYLARPCQYESRDWEGCDPSLWTSARYSQQVVDAASSAIDMLMTGPSRSVILVGYSGGGVIAALLATQRDDVAGLVTVAANLDTDVWTQGHGVSPLAKSRNPVDAARTLAGIPQVHFAGNRDTIVPATVLASYAAKLGLDPSLQVITRATYDHQCCWAEEWTELLPDALDRLQVQRSSKRGD